MTGMRRTVARFFTWWLRLFLLGVVLVVELDLGLWALAVPALFIVAMAVRVPRDDRPATVVHAPVRGRWVGINSPGTKVPSHGTTMYGQTRAVDLIAVDEGHPAQDAYGGWSPVGRRPETYRSFGRPVHAMAPGTVVRAHARLRDHRARNTWPLLAWMMLPEAVLRELWGVHGMLGNHVIVRHEDGTVAVYAHLQRRSVSVRPGESVTAGQVIGAVGNTGNSSEPHLHVQLMDHEVPQAAAGLAMAWRDVLIDPEQREAALWGTGPTASAEEGVPPGGQVFEVG